MQNSQDGRRRPSQLTAPVTSPVTPDDTRFDIGHPTNLSSIPARHSPILALDWNHLLCGRSGTFKLDSSWWMPFGFSSGPATVPAGRERCGPLPVAGMAEPALVTIADDQHLPEKATLTPPASVELPKMEDLSSSELSDLEAEQAVDEILPDHYYGGGKIPVFKPVSSRLAYPRHRSRGRGGGGGGEVLDVGPQLNAPLTRANPFCRRNG